MTEEANTKTKDEQKQTWVQEIDFKAHQQLATEKHNTGCVFLQNKYHKWTPERLTYETRDFAFYSSHSCNTGQRCGLKRG